ncbi:MAG: 50S ribosomal protein L29 [Proteobacteria bacterium]|jgi:large subunit ribosomal protein L29|nr:50S ribosomal protein L29 [Pseudomonadota bacterium]
MKSAELVEKSNAELVAMVADCEKEYFRLKMRHVTGQLEKVSELAKVRKDIARIKTEIRAREMRG